LCLVPSKCSVKHCSREVLCRGWCERHYRRWRRHGDPLTVVKGPERRRVCPRCGGSGPTFKGHRICKKCKKKDTYAWRKTNKEKHRLQDNARANERHRANRVAVLAAYGGECSCCGESHPAFLAIDHKKGGGNAHRRSLSSSGKMVGSSNMYAWLVRNKFPKGFQVLCHNCNFAKSHHLGGCPHKRGHHAVV